MPTPTQQLADVKLGGDGALSDFVRERRLAGRPWRLISRDLYEQIGLDVTYETLRSWFPDDAVEATA